MWTAYVRASTEIDVPYPVEILSYPSELSLLPNELERFNVTVQNSAFSSYTIALESSLDNLTYQETYTTFSMDLYAVKSGVQKLSAWVRTEPEAPAINTSLTVEIVREAYPPELVGYWKFDEGNGTTTQDATGNNRTGIINGASWVAGKQGKALRFDGIDDYVEILDSEDLNFKPSHFTYKWHNERTFEAWIYSEVPQEGVVRPIVDKNTTFGIFYDHSIPELRGVRFCTGGGHRARTIAKGNVNISHGEWHHYVAVKRYQGSVKLYLNGKEIPSTRISGDCNYNGTLNQRNITIGSNQGLTGWFKGIIDEVRVYHVALTEEEVQTRYAGRKILTRPRPYLVEDVRVGGAGPRIHIVIIIANDGAPIWVNVIMDVDYQFGGGEDTYRQFVESGEVIIIEDSYGDPCASGLCRFRVSFRRFEPEY
jgi:hypothetical protein